MTDESYVFNQTMHERAKSKTGAMHRKNGSRSKKCTLPSDHLTKKEREKMNGPVQSIKMNRPYNDWRQFRSLPESMQVEYLNNLITKYGARGCDIAQMFDISSSCLYATCKGYVDKVYFPRGKHDKMTERFEDFLTSPGDDEEPVTETKLVAPPLYKKKEADIPMQKITLGQLRQYLDCGESIEVVMDDEEWDSFSRIKASSKLLDPFNDWTIIEMGLGNSPASSLLLPRIRIRN